MVEALRMMGKSVDHDFSQRYSDNMPGGGAARCS